MLANLIISSNPAMASQKEANSIRTTHFAPNLEVFNYTGAKSTNSDDSLLITPNQKQSERQRIIENNTFNKPSLHSKTKDEEEFENFEKQSRRRREDFLRRMTQDAAKFQQEKPVKPIQMCQEQQMMEIQGERVNESVAVQAIVPQPFVVAIQQKTGQKGSPSQAATKEGQKQVGSRKPIEGLSKENQERIQSFSKLLKSSRQKPSLGQGDQQEKIEKLKHQRRRVTQDLKTFFNLHLFNEQQPLEKHKAEVYHDERVEEPSFPKVDEQNEKNTPNFERNRRESLIERAVARLSGGNSAKRVKRERITLDTNQIYGMLNLGDIEKEGWISKIDAIKDEVERLKNQPSQQVNHQCKETLRKYLEETNLRVKGIDEKNHFLTQQNLKIQQGLRQQEGFLRYLQQQIDKRTAEEREMMQQQAQLKKLVEPSEKTKALRTPLFYLEDNLNIRITNFQAKNAQQNSIYVLDFIIDRDIYCRVKRSDNHAPTIFIRPSTAAELSPPEWTIDIKLRIEVLSKYFKLRLERLEPIGMLFGLGRYYEQLELLETDFQMIEKIYELNQLTLSSSNDRLSFKLDIHYNMSINVIVNLLNFTAKDYYQLEVTSLDEKNNQDAPEVVTFEDSGSHTLISFITSGLERVLV